ncbi:uncharacterized protein [Asterias amurensis]|uniref:uncharacterized protein n=1 Tax=Asterias amurensis TaxID=7602 RepID=UPI003AB46E40
METITYLQIFKLVFLILCQCFTLTSGIRALRLPSSFTAIEGGRAEFNCTAADKTSDEELYWAIKWDDGSLLTWYYIPAERTTNHEYFFRGKALTTILVATLGDHGRYSTVHRQVSTSNGSHVDLCLLQIDNTQDEDQGKFYCVYKVGGSIRNMYATGQNNQAQLTVVTPPEGDVPSCGVSQIADAAPTFGGALVELSCISSIASNPLPTLTWVTGDKELFSTTGNANLYRYSLKEQDNGREFVCLVTHPSLVTPRKCSVLPLNEPPNGVITKEKSVSAVGSSAVFKCLGSGIPYIVKYTWLVGESSFSHSNTDGANTPEISYVGSEGSTLRLPNLKRSSNNTRVTCGVSLPSGLSSNASAWILLRESLPLSVAISPKRLRVFKDSDIYTFTCFAETEDSQQLFYTWYVDGLQIFTNTSENHPFGIKNIGHLGSTLLISKERALMFDNDVMITCDVATTTGLKATDSGILISQRDTHITVNITPKVFETSVGGEANFKCATEPVAPQNSTFVWMVNCLPDQQAPEDFWSESGSQTITLSTLNHATQCDITCSVSMLSGLTASATGLLVVHSPEYQSISIGEVKQPETRSTEWRLPSALAAGGVGTILGIFFCSMLLLLYSCAKGYNRYNKTGGTTSRVQISTPIYETINPQCGNRDQVAPEVPLSSMRQCQQQSNATYNRPPIELPILQVAMPVQRVGPQRVDPQPRVDSSPQRATPKQRVGLQRVPSSESQVDSLTSSISKDSLDFSGMNSSPSTATFGRDSDDSDDHEYESCEITTCV